MADDDENNPDDKTDEDDSTDESPPDTADAEGSTDGDDAGEDSEGGTDDQEPEDDPDTERILRENALITDGELRIEVARVLERSVSGDETVLLRSRTARFHGGLQIARQSRATEVHGDYIEHTGSSNIIAMGDSMSETVNGGIFQQASVEAEHIMGGAYTGTWLGPILRTVAWSDYLAWGGWADTDATRVEMAGLAIRSYMGYAHTANTRVIKATSLIDDWILRTETFGTFIDNQLDAVVLGGPGGAKELLV